MMACVANKIAGCAVRHPGLYRRAWLCDPNLHRFLKNKDIDIELHTAGRTNAPNDKAENTDEGRRKFREEPE